MPINRIPKVVPMGWESVLIGEMIAIACVTGAGMKCLFSIDPSGEKGEWERHLSLSRDDRYPGWDEMKRFVYSCGLFDPNKPVYMILPAKNKPQEYVNTNKNCFHWWQEEKP